MPSQKSSELGADAPAIPRAKAPTRARGAARVQALLAAAETVFAARGVEAATMTEIAQAAGASIGSLYQFFPTKEALADALHGAFLDLIQAELAELAAAALPPDTRAVAMMERFAAILVAHPAFPALADRRAADPAAKAEKRALLRAGIARLLRAPPSPLSEPAARATAVILLALLRAMMQLASEGDDADVRAALSAMRAMVRRHVAQIAAGAAD